MKTIRRNIFETNSSSTHSLVLNHNDDEYYVRDFYDENLFKDGILRFSALGRAEFGEITGMYDKIQYILGVLAGGLIMKEEERIENETGHFDPWMSTEEIDVDWLENNADIKWFADVVRVVLSNFNIQFKGFDFRSYRNMDSDNIDGMYCGGEKFKRNRKRIWNPLDHECMEWGLGKYGVPKERIFGVRSIVEVLMNSKISIVYWRNG